ncbi:extracellular solute-binding protein [Cohnella sp. LGH]|uniref:extracellular solute-binding protein n=1 Tax=Cohnella sp. LGH TaxID=1619153 RepID=UPI001ADB285C|nr:extracellular solute-binding protein [Cohnella sp. LGH]QTH40573.1 extracellular solute-binding protein [Cohnella sp. LGH]
MMRRENEFLYTKLYKTLKEQILSGLIKPGEYLLPESDLSAHYGLSRKSVRSALALLHDEGLIVKRVGLGTMIPEDLVIEKPAQRTLRILSPSPAFFLDRGLPILVEAFKRKHPDIEVKVLGLPINKFWESLRSGEEMGLSADLVLVPDMNYSAMDNIGDFIDLSSHLSDVVSNIYPKIMSHFSEAGGGIKAAPFTFSSVFMSCNPQLFAQGGLAIPKWQWTFDEFLSAAEQLTRVQDGITVQYGFSMHAVINRWLAFAMMNGLKHSDAAGQKQVLSQSLSILQDLFFRKRIATTFPEVVWPRTPFIHGKSAMVMTTTFEMANWQNENMTFAPQTIPLPFGNDRSTLLLANAFMVPASSENTQLAAAFVRTALEDDTQRTLAGQTLFLSVKDNVNRNVKSEDYLRLMNLAGDAINDNYFIHELIDEGVASTLEEKMSMFWLGLESVDTIVGEFERLTAKYAMK